MQLGSDRVYMAIERKTMIFWCEHCESVIFAYDANDKAGPHYNHRDKILFFEEETFNYEMKRMVSNLKIQGRVHRLPK